MSNQMTPQQMRDPNYLPPIQLAVPLGFQHVISMFIANVTPPIIIAGAAGFGFGSNSPDFPSLIYMMQMCMLLAGVTTLLQTVGAGPIGARLPIVQGTSFAFLPIMLPLVAGGGVEAMALLSGGVLVGGLFQASLSPFIGRLRFALPPMVTGLIILMIGLSLLKVGVQYSAGGVSEIGKPEFGSLANWSVAATVVIVTLFLKLYVRGVLSTAAVLIGLIVGYLLAYVMGMVDFGNLGSAATFAMPELFPFGIEFSAGAIIGISMMAFISAIETVGDVSCITKAGADREPSDRELQGAISADGLGTALSSVAGALPNTSFSQNVGLVVMTRVMSRHVATIGALLLIACGLIPKVAAIIATIPIEVLGGGVIVMFGMVVSSSMKILAEVEWNTRNMIIFGTSLSLGLGLMQVPEAMQHLSGTTKALLATGLLPAALCAIVLNLIVPQSFAEK